MSQDSGAGPTEIDTTHLLERALDRLVGDAVVAEINESDVGEAPYNVLCSLLFYSSRFSVAVFAEINDWDTEGVLDYL